MDLRVFMPHPEGKKVRFETICLKVILFYAGNLKIYLGNLGTIIGAKLCHALSMLIKLLHFQPGTGVKFLVH